MPAAHGRERIANSQELRKEHLSPNSGAVRVHMLALRLLSKQLGPIPHHFSVLLCGGRKALVPRKPCALQQGVKEFTGMHRVRAVS